LEWYPTPSQNRTNPPTSCQCDSSYHFHNPRQKQKHRMGGCWLSEQWFHSLETRDGDWISDVIRIGSLCKIDIQTNLQYRRLYASHNNKTLKKDRSIPVGLLLWSNKAFSNFAHSIFYNNRAQTPMAARLSEEITNEWPRFSGLLTQIIAFCIHFTVLWRRIQWSWSV
jgi:hypothetical protein